jgi:hypothetical protein
MPIPVNVDFYLAMVVFGSDAANDEGGFVNTWFFQDTVGGRPTGDVADDIEADLNTFYTSVNTPATKTVTQLMSPAVDATGAAIKVYNLGQAAPRTPIPRTLALTTPQSSQALPNEVAAVFSFHSGDVSAGGGTLDKTRRGRIYLGPFGTGALKTWASPEGDAELHADLINAVRYSYNAMDNSLTDVQHMQYSRKLDRFDEVSQCFIDNRFDTQRRRGFRAATRTVFLP